jgi:hypothetical protein
MPGVLGIRIKRLPMGGLASLAIGLAAKRSRGGSCAIRVGRAAAVRRSSNGVDRAAALGQRRENPAQGLL